MSRSQGPRSRRILSCLSVSLTLVLGVIGGASSAWAWGDLGHKIVCERSCNEAEQVQERGRIEVMQNRE